MTAREKRNTPVRNTSNTSSQISSAVPCKGQACNRLPALLTGTSTRPNVASVACTARCTSASSVTLPGTASARPPAAVIESAISSRISLRRPVIVTLAPSRANVVAMAAPMPVPPPVTMATLSASRMEVSRSGLTGRVLVCVSRGFDGGVRTATEHDARDAVARRPPRNGRVPGEQAERAAIFCQHVGAELMDASLLSRTKDLLEKDRTESESLPAVLHDETDFGGGHFVAGAVPRHADQFGLLPVGDFGDERHPLAIVDVGQGVRFLWKEPPEGEESLVHRAWAQPMAQGHQARPVVGADRAEANGGAVAQCHDLLTMSCSTVLGAAPTTRSMTAPSLTNRIVGIDRMPYRAASPGFSSTLTFISVTRPSEASASSSRTGAIARHGPHHLAQKSIITRPWVATSASSKLCSVRCIVSATP